MGDELEFLQPLLRPMEELAMSVPWPGTIEGRKVVIHNEDDIVAVDDETLEADPIDREDIVLWKLDAEGLFSGIASAMGFVGTPASVGPGNRLWWLGEYVPVEGERFPVYLATTRDSNDLANSAGYVSALTMRPFVLVTPTRNGASEMLQRVIDGRTSAWITLEETLTWEGEGVFVTKRPMAETLRAFTSTHSATPGTTRGRHGGDPIAPLPAGAASPVNADGDIADQVRRLNEMQRNVIVALAEKKVIGVDAANQPGQTMLARWAGYDCDATFKGALSALVKAGFLDNGRHHGRRGGYFLTAKGRQASGLIDQS
jgi:hypothetical protein